MNIYFINSIICNICHVPYIPCHFLSFFMNFRKSDSANQFCFLFLNFSPDLLVVMMIMLLLVLCQGKPYKKATKWQNVSGIRQ